MFFRELKISCRKVIVIKVNFTGKSCKSSQVGCYFSQLGSCGALATADLFVEAFKNSDFHIIFLIPFCCCC